MDGHQRQHATLPCVYAAQNICALLTGQMLQLQVVVLQLFCRQQANEVKPCKAHKQSRELTASVTRHAQPFTDMP